MLSALLTHSPATQCAPELLLKGPFEHLERTETCREVVVDTVDRGRLRLHVH